MKKIKIIAAIALFLAGLSISAIGRAQTALNIGSPTAGQTWALGGTQTINWTLATTAGYGQTAPTVNISIIPTNNTSNVAPYIIAQNAADTGSYTWTVPATLASTYQGPITLNVGLSDSSASGTQNLYITNASGASATTTSPTLTELTPTSGTAGTLVTAMGYGFNTTSTTTLMFGNSYIPNLSAGNNGTTLQFTVPSQTTPCPPWNVGACIYAPVMITPGSYDVSVANASGTASSTIMSTASPLVFTVTAPSPAVPISPTASSTPPMTSIPFPGSGTFPDGTLLRSGDNPTVYLVRNGELVPFTRPNVFLAYNYSWSQIQTVQPGQISNLTITSVPVLAPDGSLIRSESDPTVYLVSKGGQKSAIPTAASLNRLGLSLSKVMTLGDSELQNYPTTAPQE